MPGRLRDLLRNALGTLPQGPIAVALSGGLDSSVLLHLLSGLPEARQRGLRAIHVDHGLHADSGVWSAQCARACADCEVPLTVLRTEVERGRSGLEAAARRVRFAALQSALVEGEIVAFAHHRDDQAETVLLKLLRGAGPEGLGAMRTLRRLGEFLAWRPLLGISRSLLHSYADAQQLRWVSDPSNADTLIDRNFLRIEILPRLRARWPEADASIVQSASWVRAAADFIEAESIQALARVQGLDPHTLRHRDWLALPEALRDPVLRRWLRGIGLPGPNQYQVAELVRQLAEAGEDKLPCIRWPGAELRRYRDLVYALQPLPAPSVGWERDWDGSALKLPASLGTLSLVGVDGESPPLTNGQRLRVRFRHGGESLRLAAGAHRRELRDLFQEAGIPPWKRGRIPMVFDEHGELLGVGDLWLSDSGRSLFTRLRRQLHWNHALTA
ncbi:tRNA lysidine(34) synthetase TilS [Dokdonella immobilis]|uniref:tRNA(Ile)-lysidine synthase n=1 Tax=Dokdonella immobilis TaxID=578942 RepID=A0A1I4WNA7_9GAMM|nr:tRNA lysidine(34) synthetase TilS [Dokdonella immobilis]SFN15271.1 tRNA(Ile)-lysidine synthase [Dokdonella immobilis]